MKNAIYFMVLLLMVFACSKDPLEEEREAIEKEKIEKPTVGLTPTVKPDSIQVIVINDSTPTTIIDSTGTIVVNDSTKIEVPTDSISIETDTVIVDIPEIPIDTVVIEEPEIEEPVINIEKGALTFSGKISSPTGKIGPCRSGTPDHVRIYLTNYDMEVFEIISPVSPIDGGWISNAYLLPFNTYYVQDISLISDNNEQLYSVPGWIIDEPYPAGTDYITGEYSSIVISETPVTISGTMFCFGTSDNDGDNGGFEGISVYPINFDIKNDCVGSIEIVVDGILQAKVWYDETNMDQISVPKNYDTMIIRSKDGWENFIQQYVFDSENPFDPATDSILVFDQCGNE